jgi:hypothetical protein
VEHTESENYSSGVVTAGDPEATMAVLKSHVPLTLLMDIANVDGPDSERISAIEGGDADWLIDTAARPAVVVAMDGPAA